MAEPAPAPTGVEPGGAAGLVASESTESNGAASQSGAGEARKRVYSGNARLIVDDVAEAKESITDLASRSGGYIEWVHETSVSIRVPAAEFERIFERILTFGEVDFKSIETFDVTDYYSDIEGRLRIARETRERLYALLEETDDVEERVRVLREIRRLTEEIERLEGTIRTLDSLVSFSRIEVELRPRLPVEEISKDDVPFGWIAALDPLNPSLRTLPRKVSIDAGDELAVFDDADYFRAESATGVRVRLASTENSPRGDSRFWARALAYHLGPFYRSADRTFYEIAEPDEGFEAVRFVSKDRNPFVYLVGVVAREKELYVLEIFSPAQNTFEGIRAQLETIVSTVSIR